MNRARIYRWTRMRRYIERSSDAGPSSLRLFCLGCIIATRGYDFREGQEAVCHVGVIEALTEFTVSGQLHDVIACPPMAAAGCK
jgi:hypothetical protein